MYRSYYLSAVLSLLLSLSANAQTLNWKRHDQFLHLDAKAISVDSNGRTIAVYTPDLYLNRWDIYSNESAWPVFYNYDRGDVVGTFYLPGCGSIAIVAEQGRVVRTSVYWDLATRALQIAPLVSMRVFRAPQPTEREFTSQGFTLGDTVYITTQHGLVRAFKGPIDVAYSVPTSYQAGAFFSATAEDALHFYASGAKDIYTSSDRGLSWTLHSTLDAGSSDTVSCLYASGTLLLAGTRRSGLWQFDDAHAKWNRVPSVSTDGIVGIHEDMFGKVVVATRNHGIFRNDSGIWAPYNNGLPACEIRAMTCANGGNLFLATSSGAFQWRLFRTQWYNLDPLLGTIESIQTGRGSEAFVRLSSPDYRYMAGDRPNDYRTTDACTTLEPLLSNTTKAVISSVAMDSAGYLYCVTDYGVARSADSAHCWQMATTDLLSVGFQSRRVASFGQHIVMFVGDGELWRSTDDGLTWAHPGWPTGLADFASNGDKLYATDSHLLYSSTDHGATWSRLSSDSSNNILTFELLANGGVVAIKNSAVYYSTDGQSLTKAQSSLPYVVSLQVVGNTPYAVTLQGVYRSDDGGRTWTKLYQFTSTTAAFIANGFAIVSDADHTYRSTDDGRTWSEIKTLPSGIKTLRQVGSLLFAAGRGGLYRSFDNGLNWSAANYGLPTGGLQDFAITDKDSIIASSDGVLLRSHDHGATWKVLATAPLQTVSAIQADTLVMSSFAGNRGAHSTDAGDTWAESPYLSPFLDVDSVGAIYHYGNSVDPVVRTTDFGVHYTTVRYSADAIALATGPHGQHYAIEPNRILARTTDLQNFYRTTIPADVGKRGLTALAVAPSGAVYVLTGTNQAYIQRSTDLGQTWQVVFTGDSNIMFNSLKIGPDATIYAGTTQFGSGSSGTSPAILYTAVDSSHTFGAVASMLDKSVDLWPNPARHVLHVEGLLHAQAIEIRDALGRVVLSRTLEPQEALDLSDLQAGIYYLQTSDETLKPTSFVVLP